MKRIITLLLSFVMLIVVCLSAVGCATQSRTNEIDLPETAHNQTENEQITAYKITLNSDGAVTQSEDYVAKTLIATVTPSNATNKAVTWSIAWEDDTDKSGVKISDYYQVIPSAEGSNIAEVRCYAAPQFTNNNAIVTVKTVEGGFKANCRVRFEGLPTDMDITSSYTKDSSGNHVVITDISNAKTYNFNIDLSNVFNFVGSGTNCTYEILTNSDGTVVTGNCKTATFEYDATNLQWYYGTYETVAFNSFKDEINVSITGTTLNVNVDYTSMYRSYEREANSDFWFDRFYSIPETEECLMKIKVTNSTGLSEILTIKFMSGVDGVTLDQNDIVF